MAIRVEDTDAMLALAMENRTRLFVGHNMRHMPVIRQMKAIVDSGRIGRVRAIWCRHFVGTGGDFYFKDWHADRSKATSLLLQKGAHDIDVIHWLAGGYTRRVSGIGDLAVYGDVMGPVILEAEMWLLEAKARAETATALCQTNKRSKEQHA